MTEENVERARRGYKALNAGFSDEGALEAFIAKAYDSETVLDMGVLGGTFRGHRGVQLFIEGQLAILEGLRAEPTAFIDAGEHVVVPFRLSGRAKNTQLPFQEDYIHVLTFRGDKVTRTRLFRSRAKALEAVGLLE
jgi:ketosteroid isomerase-like protein